MGSKIKRPNAEAWREMNAPWCAYILVLRQEDNEVIHLVESEKIPGTKDGEIFTRLEARYLELSKEYPLPTHDIIQAQAVDLAELSGVFGAEDGFSGLKVEKITSV